ncbi:MAG: excinuclease ABC subunit UvrC [bacterium]
MFTVQISDQLRRTLEDLPDKPGCYLMRDRRGRIIYVGKAASLRKRVQSYFRAGTWRRADPKLRGLVRSVDTLDYVVLRNEAEALLTESQLIKDYKPRYNVDLRDDKRFLMLRIDPHDPWPAFKAVRLRRDDGALYFGPYVSSPAARAAMKFIEKRFGLRRCLPRSPGPENHRHCIDDIVRFCSAPCMARVTPEEYGERVGGGCAFLRGELPELLEEVRLTMEQAGAEKKFEDAAAWRDMWFMLKDIVGQRARVVATPEMKRHDAREGLIELQKALGLASPPKRIECYDISNISGTHSVASMVCSIDGIPAPSRYRHFRIKTVQQSDDPAMMAEVIRRRFERLQQEGGETPDLLVVDGGVSQLNAALHELGALGMAQVPAIGLAKRFEEIHIRGQSQPLRLATDSRALYILQRARDEAHRFALDYHRRLRARRIRESVLDEIPGIGSKRKAALLEHFGSVARLRRATPEELSRLPGVGLSMAKDILKRLESPQNDACA